MLVLPGRGSSCPGAGAAGGSCCGSPRCAAPASPAPALLKAPAVRPIPFAHTQLHSAVRTPGITSSLHLESLFLQRQAVKRSPYLGRSHSTRNPIPQAVSAYMHDCEMAARLTGAGAADLPRRDGLSGSSATLLRLLLCSSAPPLMLRGPALLSRLPALFFLPRPPGLARLWAAWLSSPLSEAVSGPTDDASSPSACK